MNGHDKLKVGITHCSKKAISLLLLMFLLYFSFFTTGQAICIDRASQNQTVILIEDCKCCEKEILESESTTTKNAKLTNHCNCIDGLIQSSFIAPQEVQILSFNSQQETSVSNDLLSPLILVPGDSNQHLNGNRPPPWKDLFLNLKKTILMQI